ncbi:MAG: response regulator transcription factor [Betaproteobacteria bacterium]|nr:response regulator transcription factor [Betaproteobacteria bacterium]
MKMRIMLADDHQLFRDALRSMLKNSADLEVVAETGNGLDVVNLAQEFAPDIVCMDIGMPGMNGIETTRRLLAACPGVKVIGLSAFSSQQYVVDMMNAGASAYVTKAGAGEELLRAIEAVRNNRNYFCPDISRVLTEALSGNEGNARLPVQLSTRERQVLQLVAEGCTSPQIAAQLRIAESTVEVHRRNIMRKLDIRGVAELTRYAIHNGLIPN